MASGIEIIPELGVMDVAAARAQLSDIFGFASEDGVMVLGSQRIALVERSAPPQHGKIDHLALAVSDLPATLSALLAKGARLESTTPDGPSSIAEFWEAGIAYVFLQGPEGARIELCQRLPVDRRAGLPGHDHIGIPCTDIAASVRFFEGIGCALLSSVSLSREDGVTEVRFLSAGKSVVELYEPPALRGTEAGFAPNALWSGLRVIGTGLAKGERIGPDGIRISLL